MNARAAPTNENAALWQAINATLRDKLNEGGIPYMGIVHGMPNAEYHQIAALGSSGLKKLARSPRHYYAAYLDPQRPIIEPTAAMRAGTLAHCAVLEPDALAKRYIVKPEGIDGRTKEGKAWAASVPAEIEIVTAEQMQTAQRQAAAIRALPDVAALLADGQTEVSAFWIDEETGEHCKCRPDLVSPAGDGVILVDLKTSQSAAPSEFARTVIKWGYSGQAAWYALGYEKASGKRVLGFVFAAVETDWPHAACAYMLSDEWLEQARCENRRLLDLYAKCKRTNEWPAWGDAIQLLDMPHWARLPTTTGDDR